jgi:hypothetical protein
MTGLDLAGAEERSQAFEPCLTLLIRIAEHPAKADNAVSKNNADYEIGLCAARASSIIHFNF